MQNSVDNNFFLHDFNHDLAFDFKFYFKYMQGNSVLILVLEKHTAT